MSKGEIILSYPDQSFWTLEPVDEDRLADLIRQEDLEVSVTPGAAPARRGQPASILFEPTLIIQAAGVLVATKILQLVIEDLYRFFKGYLQTRKENRAPARTFLVILHIDVGGQGYHVAVDFKDEVTLAIGFYRLHAYIHTGSARGDSRLVGLEFPKEPWFAPLTFIMAWLGSFCVLGTPAYLLNPDFKLWCAVLLVALVSVPLAVNKYYQKWRYRKKYADGAMKWALELTPLPELPDHSAVEISFGASQSLAGPTDRASIHETEIKEVTPGSPRGELQRESRTWLAKAKEEWPIFLGLLLLGLLLWIPPWFIAGHRSEERVTYEQLFAYADKETIRSVTISDYRVRATLKNGHTVVSYIRVPQSTLIDRLQKKNIGVAVAPWYSSPALSDTIYPWTVISIALTLIYNYIRD